MASRHTDLANTVSGVIEITKGTNRKLEVMKEIEGNPVMQDYTSVRGQPSHVKKHRNYVKAPVFNYGFLPQTWCDNTNGADGDGDAIDLVDLSWKEIKPILAVSDYLVLGVIGLIDQGEMDYKILGMEVNEASERSIKTLDDYRRFQSGQLDDIMVWFRDYKLWEGKSQNKFLWNGEIKGAQHAMDLIRESNDSYKSLLARPEQSSYWFPSLKRKIMDKK